MRLFEEKVGKLREMLDVELARGEAAELLSTLIESVTIHPGGEHGAKARVVAKTADLLAFATNANAAPKGGMYNSIIWLRGQDLNL